MNKKEIGYEMARRKVMFHHDESWETIRLWGLFNWGTVSSHLKSGALKTDMVKENKTIWVWPSEEFYHQFIQPSLAEHLIKAQVFRAPCR